MIDRMINIKKRRKRILNLIIQKSCLGEMMEIMESIFLYTNFQINEFVFYYIICTAYERIRSLHPITPTRSSSFGRMHKPNLSRAIAFANVSAVTQPN